MERLLDPKIDFIFKNIFGNKTSSNILISLLNAVLGYKKDSKRITEITIDDSFIKKENIEDKFSVLDIKATLSDGTRINIEMQIIDQYDMKKRRDAEIRIKAMSDRASSLAGAREEGMQQGMQQSKLEIIINMLKNQLDDETISKFSGISIEEIREIKKHLKTN